MANVRTALKIKIQIRDPLRKASAFSFLFSGINVLKIFFHRFTHSLTIFRREMTEAVRGNDSNSKPSTPTATITANPLGVTSTFQYQNGMFQTTTSTDKME